MGVMGIDNVKMRIDEGVTVRVFSDTREFGKGCAIFFMRQRI